MKLLRTVVIGLILFTTGAAISPSGDAPISKTSPLTKWTVLSSLPSNLPLTCS